MHKLLTTALSIKDDNITLLDAVVEAMRRLEIEPKRAGGIIKRNEGFLGAMLKECREHNLLKGASVKRVICRPADAK